MRITREDAERLSEMLKANGCEGLRAEENIEDLGAIIRKGLVEARKSGDFNESSALRQKEADNVQ